MKTLRTTGSAAGVTRPSILSMTARGSVLVASGLLTAATLAQEPVYEQIIARDNPKADIRIPYGEKPQQFGDLWLPRGNRRSPVILLVHGGCWSVQYPAIELVNQAADALRARGYAVWSIEYRRVGELGGGYPGTFLDVANGADFLRELSREYPLDLSNVVAVGHSAGGPLALWLAGRRNLPPGSPLSMAEPVTINAVVNLGGVGDLKHFEPFSPPVCREGTVEWLVGTGQRHGEDPFADTSPSELLPLNTKQVLVYGVYDAAIPPFFGKHYQDLAAAKGEDVELVIIPDAAHFDIIATWTPAWTTIVSIVDRLVDDSGNARAP